MQIASVYNIIGDVAPQEFRPLHSYWDVGFMNRFLADATSCCPPSRFGKP